MHAYLYCSPVAGLRAQCYLQDPTELGTLVSGVNCTVCKFSYLLPRHPLDYNTVWECQVLY